MKLTDLWFAALLRLGTERITARRIITMATRQAPSQTEIDHWNVRIPSTSAGAFRKSLRSPKGDAVAKKLVRDFRELVVREFGIPEGELRQIMAGVGGAKRPPSQPASARPTIRASGGKKPSRKN